jgi:hypothetical protein
MSHHDTTWTEVEEAHNTWVTIFGFPPSAASYILSQFSHCGNILEKRMPAKGSWMHIRCQTKLECRKALSNRGKVFGEKIMMGVMLCKDQVISICKYIGHKFIKTVFCCFGEAGAVCFVFGRFNLCILFLCKISYMQCNFLDHKRKIQVTY